MDDKTGNLDGMKAIIDRRGLTPGKISDEDWVDTWLELAAAKAKRYLAKNPAITEALSWVKSAIARLVGLMGTQATAKEMAETGAKAAVEAGDDVAAAR